MATPTNPTLTALQTQQAIEDAKLKILQDQAGQLAGLLPSSTATPNSGAFAVTGSAPFPCQKLAYDQLLKVAKVVAATIADADTVIIYDSNEINNLLTFKTARRQLELLSVQMGKVEATADDLHKQADLSTRLATPHIAALAPTAPAATLPPILVPGLAEGSLKVISDILGLFRTNTSIAFSALTVDDAALTAAVEHELLEKKVKVYVPSVMPIDAAGSSSRFGDLMSDLQSRVASIQNQMTSDQVRCQVIGDALASFITADESSQANNDQVTAEADPAKLRDLKTRQSALDRARELMRQAALTLVGNPSSSLDVNVATASKAQIDRYLKVVAAFLASLTSVTTALTTMQTSLLTAGSSGVPPLAMIFRAEKLEAIMGSAQVLAMKTSVLGGSVVTRINLFTGGHLLYTGGAIASFTVFEASGLVRHAGTIVEQSGKAVDRF